MKMIGKIIVPKASGDIIDNLLSHEPETEYECFGEDELIMHSYHFLYTDMEMDIKLCGVQFEEGCSNLPWTEAVLFKNGCEVACSEVEDEYFGEWELEHDGVIYACIVKKGE